MDTTNTNRETLKAFRAQVRACLDAPLKVGVVLELDRLTEELTSLVKFAQDANGCRLPLSEVADLLGLVGLHLRLVAK